MPTMSRTSPSTSARAIPARSRSISSPTMSGRCATSRSPAARGAGRSGLAMTRKWIGPALIRNVSISGFDVGVDVASSEYGVTIDNIAITGSRTAGLRNAGNMVSAHRLSIAAEAGPAVANTGPGGLIVIQDGDFSGAGAPAFENAGYLNLSGIRIAGVSSGLPQAAEASPDGIYSPTERIGDPAWSLRAAEPPDDRRRHPGQMGERRRFRRERRRRERRHRGDPRRLRLRRPHRLFPARRLCDLRRARGAGDGGAHRGHVLHTHRASRAPPLLRPEARHAPPPARRAAADDPPPRLRHDRQGQAARPGA